MLKLFYCAGKPHTFKSREGVQQVIRHDREVLAERDTATRIVWGDKQASVLGAVGLEGSRSIRYSAYGGSGAAANSPGLIGYAGYYLDAISGHYMLGNGYRSYSPGMMRFLSSDSLSPFGRGGVNAYAYCAGNPIGRVDPDGRFWGSAVIVKKAKIKVGNSASPALRRFVKSGTGSERSRVKVATLTAEFKDQFDATPVGQLNFEEMMVGGEMTEFKAMVLYRSMKNAKRAYVAAAANELEIDLRGMFPQQMNKVLRMMDKLRRARDFSIPFQENDQGFQRAHAANMRKMDGRLKSMRMERDALAIRLAERLNSQE